MRKTRNIKDNIEENRTQNVREHDGVHSQQIQGLPLLNLAKNIPAEVLPRHSANWKPA